MCFIDDELMDEVKCNGCNKETDNCRCQELVCAFNKTNQYLSDMNLLDRLAGYTLTNLIQERINTHVQDTCKGIFDMSHIDNLLQVGSFERNNRIEAINDAFVIVVVGHDSTELADAH